MKRAVIFGAGNIGRGFLGELFFRSGYRIVFVDVVAGVVDALNRFGRYPHWVVSDEKTEKSEITGVSAVSALDEPAVARLLAGADIAATAVGVGNLARIAPLLAAGLRERFARPGAPPLNIIICENMLSAGVTLRGAVAAGSAGRMPEGVLEEKTGFVETVVSRMVPPVPPELARAHPLLVMVEPYNTLPVGRPGFRGEMPDVAGFLPVPDIHAWEEQKLYVHNLGHSVCAYHGFIRGRRFIWEAVRDASVREKLLGALGESSLALAGKHPFLKQGLPAHIDDLVARFGNRALGDTVHRVGREPLRKLGPSDRLVGALSLCREQGAPCENICFAIACALRYDYREDPEALEMQSLISRGGIEAVLTGVSGLAPGDPALKTIREHWERT